MFVKFECGCVGLRLDGVGDIVIRDCRGEGEDDLGCTLHAEGLTKSERGVQVLRRATPLTPEQINALLAKVARVLGAGRQWFELRSTLKWMVRD